MLLLFLLFQLFWFLFHFLSNANLFANHFWYYYPRQMVVDSVGFIGFVLAIYVLFPNLNNKQQLYLYIIFSLLLIAGLGWLQFELQEWRLNSEPLSMVFKINNQSIKAAKLQQASGAAIYAMLKVAIYILLGIGYAYMLDNFKKDKKAKELENANMEAELKILRYQINPHFLFNTINNIYYLAIIQSEKTADALLQLSRILRYVLDAKKATGPLDQEIDYLEQYIDLQLFRFPDGHIIKNIDVPDKFKEKAIAPLLLITFVENAFKHGVLDKRATPIIINLKGENGQLIYEVVNQVGDKLSKDMSMGIGLANLKRRLELLYPSSHLLEISEQDGQFTAKLQLDLL